jgi:hypothetical protein
MPSEKESASPFEYEDYATRTQRMTRSISRRRFLHDLARWGLGAGVVLATGFNFPLRAQAASCSKVGVVSTWGSQCNNTTLCGSACSSGNCNTLRKRCTQWTSAESNGNYCWCSQTACRSGCRKGYYVCCDCWTGGSGGCGTGTSQQRCICRHLHVTCQGPACGCGTICPDDAEVLDDRSQMHETV